MSEENLTEEIQIEDTVYRLRKRLAWMQQGKIDSLGAAFIISGRDMKALQESDVDIEDLEKVTLATDPVRQNFERLLSRLVGVTRKQIRDLPSGHVAVLIARIRELEREEKREIEALKSENPTASVSNS